MNRPELSSEAARRWLEAGNITDGCAVIGRRGYYRDTLGRPGFNDINLYDDAIILVAPDVYLTFNANTDPSRHGENRAWLMPGKWSYRLGIHGLSKPRAQQYEALVQAAPVQVKREGTEDVPRGTVKPGLGVCLGDGVWEGWFGINIHRGGLHTTGSAGCQTIHPTQWEEFISTVSRVLEHRPTIPYLLLERGDR